MANYKNKCVKCKNAIKDTEVILVCGLWCRKTFHNECLGLSNSEARAIMSSKVRIKFHCESCEKRLAIELLGGKETQEAKNLGNCVSLLELMQKLVKLTNELSSDSSTINSKLDTVITSNARLEEYLLQSPKRFEKQNEETSANTVGYTESYSTKRMTKICDRNNDINSHDRIINNERMCRETEFQQSEVNVQGNANDFPEQVAAGQYVETLDNGVRCTKRITEICERNNYTNSHDQIINSDLTCRASEFQQPLDNLHHMASDLPEEVPDGQQRNFTGSDSSNCVQEWVVPEGHESTHAPPSVDEEEWREPDGQDKMQDAPRLVKEECSLPEDFLSSGTFSIEKTENVDDEQKQVMEVEEEKYLSSDGFLQPCALSTDKTENVEDEVVNENNFEELNHEMGSTISGIEAERSAPVSVEADKINEDSSGLVTSVVLAAGSGYGKQHTKKFEVPCANQITHPTSVPVEAEKIKEDSNGLVSTVFLAPRTRYSKQQTNKHEVPCVNQIRERSQLHRNVKCKKIFEQMQDLKDLSQMDRCETVNSCNLCQKIFLTTSSLKRHIRLHNSGRPYNCSICNKTFQRKGNLTKHIRVHTDERPFCCSICNKAFRQKWGLRMHIRFHTGERPYSCSVCYKAFSQKSDLRIHIRLHTGDRPYTCSICYKTFVAKGLLTKHIRFHTGERPFSCSICNKSFSDNSNCNRHMRVHTVAAL